MDAACMIAMDPKALRGMSVRIMEPDDVAHLQLWAAERSDLVEFEIVPVALGKNLLSLKMKLAEQRAARSRVPITEQDVAEIGSIVERTYLAVRDYLDGNEEESEGPMRARLDVVAQEWSRDTGMPISVSANGEEGGLSPQVKFQLVQVAREALANVAKHANPTNVWLDLECTPTAVSIRVRDNGRGFVSTGIRGHGMGIMNERAAMAGADLCIDSTPGEGTEVVVAYPRGQKQEGS